MPFLFLLLPPSLFPYLYFTYLYVYINVMSLMRVLVKQTKTLKPKLFHELNVICNTPWATVLFFPAIVRKY